MKQPSVLNISRPWPVDEVRRCRVRAAMRRLGMSSRELAALAQLQETDLANLSSGRWRSRAAEERVAYVLGQDVDWLFPHRTREELVAMAIAAQKERELVAERRKENYRRLGIVV